MQLFSQLKCRLQNIISMNSSGVHADLSPRQTLPGKNEVLLLQPEGGFLLKIRPKSGKTYNGEIRFDVPDPFEVRNQSRPGIADWDYDEQKLTLNGMQQESEILMKAALPEKFRGEALACISAVECTSGATLATLRMKSDPPVSST